METGKRGRSPEQRERLVAGAAEMIQRRGLAATSIRDLAAFTGAPLGSTYHYFPGGKSQIATEAVTHAGDLVERLLEQELARGPAEGLRAFIGVWRDIVVSSDFRAGCPVLAVSVEEPHGNDTAAIDAAAQVFGRWVALLAGALVRTGVTAARSRRLANLIVTSIEGSVAVCRAERSTRALDDAAAELIALVAAACSDRATDQAEGPPGT